MSDKSILLRLEDHGHEAPRVDLEGRGRPERAQERYHVIGEIGRGNLGVIYRGRDNDLGREVALKVLRKGHLDSPEVVQRFIEEAQIGGQLQHPNILPVYEIGLRDDGRPYFAMQLVKGETLAERLARRSSVSDGQRALLAAFREVCRAMTYAHAHRVIHRDLKPGNILLGSFGEVMVVDWGCGRVLPRGAPAERARPDITVISTVGSGDTNAHSPAGSALGTPGYMSPEQALGRLSDVDEQSDIFSLGAILCEILTGEPAYRGTDEERLAAAKRARLQEAHARLARCTGDRKLIKICRQCIEPLPKDRPRSIKDVADAVAASLTASEGRAHRAQLRAIKAQARAEEQRHVRRQTVAVLGAILGLILLGAGAMFWLDAGRTERQREREAAIEAALQDATRLSVAGAWEDALAAAQRAVDLGGDDSLFLQIKTERQQAMAAAQIEAADEALLSDLEGPRELYRVGGLEDVYADGDEEDQAFDEAYLQIFNERFGSVAEGRERLTNSSRAADFAACLGFWSSLRRDSDALEGAGWKALHSVACGVDPDSAEAREALAEADDDELLAAARKWGDQLPLSLVSEVGLRLVRLGREEEAVAFLSHWQESHPQDYWINVGLAAALAADDDPRRAARYAFAAVAARPDSALAWIRLGLYHKQAGDLVDATYALRRATELDPKQEIAAVALRSVAMAKAEREGVGR